MRIDNREWKDPIGQDYNDLNYGQGDARYASGVWWLIPVVLVLYGIWVWIGWIDLN